MAVAKIIICKECRHNGGCCCHNIDSHMFGRRSTLEKCEYFDSERRAEQREDKICVCESGNKAN